MAPPLSELSAQRRAAIIEGLAAKKRAAEVASEIGVSRIWVYTVAREAGMRLREQQKAQVSKDRAAVALLMSMGLRRREIAEKLGMKPNLVSKHLKIIRAPVLAAFQPKVRKSLEIPQWVPARLHDDYRVVAELDGECAAAAWARREKLGAA